MNTTPTNQCPQCGQAISGGVRGLCPSCLAMIGFGAEDEVADTVARTGHVTASAPRPLVNPAVKYFGDYELIEELARGGMGVVFKARQKSLNRTVAVKMILCGQLATAPDVKRFRTEAEAAANLQHPNIVAIHEVGEHEGQHYFSMDLVDGPTLAELVRQGPLPSGKAAQYVKAIAEAVQFAHQRGILHRDLKPSNVLVDSQDRVRVKDFGLAKVMHGDGDLTRSGDVMGSPAYMAPEQAQGKQRLVGPPSDVYSLGALLYHLLTGRPPFSGETAVETLRQALDEEPLPPSKHNVKIPADLETICLKCLAKRPEQRYATARDLAEELERFLNYEPILAKPAGGWRRAWNWTQKNPWVFAAGFALMVLVVGCVAYGFYERTRYLTWHLSTGLDSERDVTNSPSTLFFMMLPLLTLLFYISRKAFRRSYELTGRTATALKRSHVLLHAGIGLLGTLAGMGGLMLQVNAWAWKLAPSVMLPLEIAGVLCALTLNWLGLYMVWEALGVHESSRFRGAVDKAVERELASAAVGWPVMKLVGFALWLLIGGGGVILMFLTFILQTSGADMAIGIGGMVLSIGLVLLVSRAHRRRLRLFTHAFVPLVLGGYAFVFGALHLSARVVPDLFLSAVFSAVILASGTLFLPRRDKSPVSRSFPVSPRRDALYAIGLIAVIFALVHVVENWRGRREWARVKAELAAEGEALDYAAYLKPPVPPEQNVMEHPFMKAHFIKGQPVPPLKHEFYFKIQSYTFADLKKLPVKLPDSAASALPQHEPTLQGILGSYADHQDTYAQLEEALQRPHARLPDNATMPINVKLPNFVSIRHMAQHLNLRAKVHLLLGNADAALKDLQTLRRLMEVTVANDPPMLVGAMIRVSIAGLMTATLEDTLAEGLWPATHHDEIQALCDRADLIYGVNLALRGGERAGVLKSVEVMLREDKTKLLWPMWATPESPVPLHRILMGKLIPDGWVDQNLALYARLMQTKLDDVNLTRHGLNPTPGGGRDDTGTEVAIGNTFRPYAIVASVAIPNFSKALQTTARNQTHMNLACLACALERHRTAKGAYPETLAALMPDFAAAIPKDVFDGQPLRYRRTDDGKYLLWSIGENEKDDGGVATLDKDGKSNWGSPTGDWVWQGVPK